MSRAEQPVDVRLLERQDWAQEGTVAEDIALGREGCRSVLLLGVG